MKSGEMRFSIFTFFLFILISVYAPLCVGEVLFEDDFEKKEIDSGEHSLYDNVLVTTVGHSFAVNPDDALPVTWGKLKAVR